MELYSLRIEGFRRHIDTTVHFSDATFLIGENNKGKSSILHALEIILNDHRKIDLNEFFHRLSDDELTNELICDEVRLTIEFRNVPEVANNWIGFKGRILKYETNSESGNKIVFRKIFKPNTNYIVEMKEFNKVIRPEIQECKTIKDILEYGITIEMLEDLKIRTDNPLKKISVADLKKIFDLECAYDIDETEEKWTENPGGIPGVVLHKLPKFLLIPAQDKMSELSSSNGTLHSTLNELFKDVRDASLNFKEAQKYLQLLAKELDPNDENSEFAVMMGDLNNVLGSIFSNIGIKAETTLGEADKSIKPTFDISIKSNVHTSVNLQGTGVIRSAVFALLRYRTMRENNKFSQDDFVRPLIIGFEEPEIYLHPNASNLMRNTIYELASYDFNQIVCTTHSPYMIDLGQKPSQILNNLTVETSYIERGDTKVQVEKICSNPFNTSHAFKSLHNDEKNYVKMLLKMDDYISRVFFSREVLIIEGDTEDIVLRETIARMPKKVQLDISQNWQIIKARGKASIISLIKYLKASGINPYVMHDRDGGTPRAEVFNEPILAEVTESNRRFMLEECLEDILGYPAPSSDKPATAYNKILTNWGSEWKDIPLEWRKTVQSIFQGSFNTEDGYLTVEELEETLIEQTPTLKG
ncbi:putative ATP-dependent endonuclease of OLD family [Alkalihalobacillus xiaoxiensis]|uniref:ATP-dependent endonuclease of OLD family n=1 Tax=Shouchella xiaoxiensis TaxID=766895 RepID=A0ABS2SWP4_9BACI|nr:putative ATP-dependent endonuclease of OLD family [Shouchella xiaoxiensis]